jgi:hypothetical protein
MSDTLTLRDLLDKQQSARQSALEDLRRQIADRKANAPTAGSLDLTPLAAQLDSLYGGNNAAVAKEQVERHNAYDTRTNQLADELTKQTSSHYDKLAEQIALHQQQASERAARTDDAKAERNATQGARYFDNVQKLYEKDRTGLDTLNQKYGQIDQALSSGNADQIRAALTNYAKSVEGDTRVNESEVARIFSDTFNQRLAGLERYWTGKSGTLSPEELKPIAAGIANARQLASKEATKRLADRRASFQGSGMAEGFRQAQPFVEGTEGAARELGASQYRYAPSGATRPTPTSHGTANDNRDLDNMSVEELKELAGESPRSKAGTPARSLDDIDAELKALGH